MKRFDSTDWAIILGGSSGFGLATAKKLSRHGMNICIVHRDRKGAMKRIEPEFDAIRGTGVRFLAYNVNALTADGIDTVLSGLQEAMAGAGAVKVLMHSIAYGNLKLLAPLPETFQSEHRKLLQTLSREIGVSAEQLGAAFDKLFAEGYDGLVGAATPPAYNSDDLLQDEDFALTIYSMGSSLATR
jgi:NAD(P)-dependent dehydrogenase (short-subunit alcohol dehydrogenase family)